MVTPFGGSKNAGSISKRPTHKVMPNQKAPRDSTIRSAQSNSDNKIGIQMSAGSTIPNANKLAKNPALNNLNIFEELEMFKGVPPYYDITFSES